jgi:hypothetical protein
MDTTNYSQHRFSRSMFYISDVCCRVEESIPSWRTSSFEFYSNMSESDFVKILDSASKVATFSITGCIFYDDEKIKKLIEKLLMNKSIGNFIISESNLTFCQAMKIIDVFKGSKTIKNISFKNNKLIKKPNCFQRETEEMLEFKNCCNNFMSNYPNIVIEY